MGRLSLEPLGTEQRHDRFAQGERIRRRKRLQACVGSPFSHGAIAHVGGTLAQCCDARRHSTLHLLVDQRRNPRELGELVGNARIDEHHADDRVSVTIGEEQAFVRTERMADHHVRPFRPAAAEVDRRPEE
jgi:hypothetical protein